MKSSSYRKAQKSKLSIGQGSGGEYVVAVIRFHSCKMIRERMRG